MIVGTLQHSSSGRARRCRVALRGVAGAAASTIVGAAPRTSQHQWRVQIDCSLDGKSNCRINGSSSHGQNNIIGTDSSIFIGSGTGCRGGGSDPLGPPARSMLVVLIEGPRRMTSAPRASRTSQRIWWRRHACRPARRAHVWRRASLCMRTAARRPSQCRPCRAAPSALRPSRPSASSRTYSGHKGKLQRSAWMWDLAQWLAFVGEE